MDILESIGRKRLRIDLPDFSAGDTIRVFIKIEEGEKKRLQRFEGVVLQKRGSGTGATFTVRKISDGIGVERIIPLNGPMISKIEILKRGKVRRAKIFYFRELTGKSAKIKEKR
ncbi:50S ribosomal protein L19 [candidate division WOR-3 bacterium]|jgi:large subunit ribosomal protein L19|nr:50S ribosomal protein L19 [candidate division WOR-3 bacterium]